jgi:dihydroxyacetone kinase
VLLAYGNYAGDVLHFGQAQERLRAEGIDVRTVLVTDDIASAAKGQEARRRGIAGDFVVFKVAGAAAEQGLGIDEVERLAIKANARTRTLGVGLAGCTLPGSTSPLFEVPSGVMSVGLGIHGEPGIEDQPLPTSEDLATTLVDRLLDDLPEGVDTADRPRAAVIVNGLGVVKYEELFVLFRDVATHLEARGVTIVDPEVGELVTSLDMAGVSVTLAWLDDELEALWSAPASSPAYRKGAIAAPVDDGIPDVGSWEIATRGAEDVSTEVATAGPFVVESLDVTLAAIRDAEDELGRIDAVAGDGDHGSGMVRGLEAALSAARDSVDKSPSASTALVAGGRAWAERAGGTSGALWGAGLDALAETLRGSDTVDAGSVAAAVTAALDAVVRLGGAQVGDKTLVDVLAPVSRALTAAAGRGETLDAALNHAARVAHDAAEATSELEPRLGRARPLAAKSIGHPDAGAVSLALILRTLADHVATVGSRR